MPYFDCDDYILVEDRNVKVLPSGKRFWDKHTEQEKFPTPADTQPL